jgi:methylenetetrahydrofolate reductase (NADPH)
MGVNPTPWKEALMALLNFKKSVTSEAVVSSEVEAFLQGYSIEVMPRTAEQLPSFRALLPLGTRG